MKVIYSIVILFYHLTSFGQNEEVTGKYEYIKNHDESGIFVVLIGYAIYCAVNLKKTYRDYKMSEGLGIEFSVFIRDLGVIVGAIIVIVAFLVKYFIGTPPN